MLKTLIQCYKQNISCNETRHFLIVLGGRVTLFFSVILKLVVARQSQKCYRISISSLFFFIPNF